MSENQDITTLELAVRAVVYGVCETNSLLVKLNSPGKVYGELLLGTGLSLSAAAGKTYLNAAASVVTETTSLPIYMNHEAAAVELPEAGAVKVYFLYDDYDFIYVLWPDGERHNRRLPLSEEELT
jgi:hypothetical protein